jgi:hypothetical protein
MVRKETFLNMKIYFGLLISFLLSASSWGQQNMPLSLNNYVSSINFGTIGNIKPNVSFQVVSPSMIKVSLSWQLEKETAQDDWQVNIKPAFTPTFHWASHLTPSDNNIIAQHVFRAPALIMASKEKQISILPDLEILGKGSPGQWYMDLDAITGTMTLGMSKSTLTDHVLYGRAPGSVYPAGKIQLGFYIQVADDSASLFDPWRNILSFDWNRFAEPLYRTGQPLERKDMEPYVKHTYDWAFTNWKKNTWQEFELNGKTVGAVAFIVNVTQSPDYPGVMDEREFRSVWNQAWFSSLRSASGLYRYARTINDTTLKNYALKTKELALSFPQHSGFFPALIATEMEQKLIGDKTYNRSKGWSTAYFGNSDRNPYENDPKKSPYHILDMSYTASLMLDWDSDLEKDPRLLTYVRTYADALLKIQNQNGFFPAWLKIDSLKPLPLLTESPETSMSVTLLLKLYDLTKNKKYLDPALKAMRAVMDNIILSGRWEDFETYYSCSSWGAEGIGKKIARNDQYKQNTLSMYWTAEALLNCYNTTHEKKYLSYGQRVLDELLMFQATWQPPYMYINTLGGFGVMNGDGEWNDSRQSLFAELIVRYGKEFNSDEYEQRGLAALRVSFAMMYCPENPKTKAQWEKVWPFFGPRDYGFMMENYGHGGMTSPEGGGIGEFTIYDWGNGAASETYNRMVDHFGKDFVENK